MPPKRRLPVAAKKSQPDSSTAPPRSTRSTRSSRRAPAPQPSAQASESEPEPPVKRARSTNPKETAQVSGDEESEVIPGFAASEASDSEVSEFTDSSSDSDDDDGEDEVAWEDVDLGKPINKHSLFPPQPSSTKLELTLGADSEKKQHAKRKITAVDRRVRMETHKLHLLCLIAHLNIRNRWIDSPAVRKNLAKVFRETTVDKLLHDPSDQQHRRSHFFNEGLKEAAEAFRKKWKVTHEGMKRARWREESELQEWKPSPGMELVSKKDFINAARRLEGSQDLGAQVFCAMLREVGITTRLVCSLQVLPFTFSDKLKLPKPAPPPPSTSRPAYKSHLRRPPLHPPAHASTPPPKPTTPKHNPLTPSDHPVFFIEAFSPSTQRWLTIPPFHPKLLFKPHLLSPPSTSPNSLLTYTLAFESPPHLLDVTRRYSPNLTARTRRLRVTITPAGTAWWKKVVGYYSRPYSLTRDQIERAEFENLELREPAPKAVADYKDHPVFALKRHLRRNEVIKPERKAGTVKMHGVVEPVFRREDVHVVRTFDGWYRLGRMVRDGELPVKFTQTRRKGRGKEEEEEGERPHQPMFMQAQTEVYVPPPVTNGLVPKNRFGNVDVYVPSMVPPGGVHIRHRLAATAARILRVDFADTVTGFEFRGREGRPKIEGCVVAEEYEEAVRAVVEGLEWGEEKERGRERVERAVERWRRWLLRLSIRRRLGVGRDESIPERKRLETVLGRERRSMKRVTQVREDREMQDGGEGDAGDEMDFDGENEIAAGGGFMPEENYSGGGFMPEDQGGGFMLEDHGGGFMPDHGGGFMPEDHSGGFMPEDQGGGFMPEDHSGGFIPDTHTGGTIPDDHAGGFMPEDIVDESNPSNNTNPAGFIHTKNSSVTTFPPDSNITTGGFIPTEQASTAPENYNSNGGFIPEENYTLKDNIKGKDTISPQESTTISSPVVASHTPLLLSLEATNPPTPNTAKEGKPENSEKEPSSPPPAGNEEYMVEDEGLKYETSTIVESDKSDPVEEYSESSGDETDYELLGL